MTYYYSVKYHEGKSSKLILYKESRHLVKVENEVIYEYGSGVHHPK